MSFQENIDPNYQFQETFSNLIKASSRIAFHEIFWGLLIDIVLIITCGGLLVSNSINRLKVKEAVEISRNKW